MKMVIDKQNYKNRKDYLKITTVIVPVIIVLLSSAHFVYAQTVIDNSIKLANPIGTNDFLAFIGMLLDIILKIGIPVATGFFIWAGFRYITAQGNPANVTAAHNNLKYVVFGTILFLGAWSITNIIIKTFQTVIGS